MATVKHYPSCSPNYPEKPKGEPPQYIVRTELGDGEVIYECADCGGTSVILKECIECHGTGRTDNHVTGEVECGQCEGTGVGQHKCEATDCEWCHLCGSDIAKEVTVYAVMWPGWGEFLPEVESLWSTPELAQDRISRLKDGTSFYVKPWILDKDGTDEALIG